MATKVRVQVSAGCPGCLVWHGAPEYTNGRVGIVLGEVRDHDGRHTVKVGLDDHFQYFAPSEITEVESDVA